MYAGEIVERATVDALFTAPQHPYTVGLLGSIPRLDHRISRLATIEGMVPNMSALPRGCRFAARCPFASDICVEAAPPLKLVSPGHWSRCIKAPLEGLVS
jgi:peptide/nickel transport system ATP-binding protein